MPVHGGCWGRWALLFLSTLCGCMVASPGILLGASAGKGPKAVPAGKVAKSPEKGSQGCHFCSGPVGKKGSPSSACTKWWPLGWHKAGRWVLLLFLSTLCGFIITSFRFFWVASRGSCKERAGTGPKHCLEVSHLSSLTVYRKHSDARFWTFVHQKASTYKPPSPPKWDDEITASGPLRKDVFRQTTV